MEQEHGGFRKGRSSMKKRVAIYLRVSTSKQDTDNQLRELSAVSDRCACRKLNPAILVMQSAQDWATKNMPGAIDSARDRRIFL
jgi:hypothetical protein